ncbi:MAG: hypothetical protein QXQ20_08610 [Candidatus Nezhaarchaeales archaeon]
MATRLKELCQVFTSSIKERMKDEFERYFLGDKLAQEVSSQFEGSIRRLREGVIRCVIEDHDDIIEEYINRVSEIKRNHQGNFAVMLAVRKMFEEGVLFPSLEGGGVEIKLEEEEIMKEFLAISNNLMRRGVNEGDLAILYKMDLDFSRADEILLSDLTLRLSDIFNCIESAEKSEDGRRAVKLREEAKRKIEDFVNTLANKTLIRFNEPANVLKERFQELIYNISQPPYGTSYSKHAELVVRQVLCQNMLFEILAFTKFVKLAFPVIPRCKIVKLSLQGNRRYEELVTEFDSIVLVEELEDEPILLVEATTRSTVEDLEEKTEKIREACKLLTEEFWWKTFVPLLIAPQETMELMRDMSGVDFPCVKFELKDFFNISSKERFLEELSRDTKRG